MEFSEASGHERIMLRLSREHLNSEFGSCQTYDGIFPPFTGDSWFLNLMLGGFVFRELKKKLKDTIVHYTTFGLPILSNNEEDIVTIHDLFLMDPQDEAYGKIFSVSRRLIERFKNFNNVLAPSYYVKSELEGYGFNGRVSVIYIPVPKWISYTGDKEEARKKMGLPQNKKLILSVSSNLRRKNLGVVAETMDRLGDEYRLIRVGNPVGNCISMSSVNEQQLNLLYNACDVLLFPSLHEGFGKPVIEAFAAGLPVVTSDIEVMREICGNAAVLVEPTAEGCIRGIKEAISNKDIFVKRGLERSQEYSRLRFAATVKRYYTDVMK